MSEVVFVGDVKDELVSAKVTTDEMMCCNNLATKTSWHTEFFAIVDFVAIRWIA